MECAKARNTVATPPLACNILFLYKYRIICCTWNSFWILTQVTIQHKIMWLRVILQVTLSLGHALTLYSFSNLKLGIKWAKLSNKIGYQFTRPAEFLLWQHLIQWRRWAAKRIPSTEMAMAMEILICGNCCLCFYRSSSNIHVSFITWHSDFS